VPFADPHAKLFQRGPLPLGGCLDDLSIYGVFVVIVDDVELNGRAGTIAVQHIVHALSTSRISGTVTMMRFNSLQRLPSMKRLPRRSPFASPAGVGDLCDVGFAPL
jgi:hypothetical protein